MRKLGTLEFGPVKVPVVAKKHIEVGGESCWGCWDSDTNIMELREGMTRGRFLAILLHEMTHACQSILAQSIRIDGDERWLYEKELIADAVGLGVGQNFDRIGRLWRAYKQRRKT